MRETAVTEVQVLSKARLGSFLNGWRSIRDDDALSDRLARFVEKAAPLLARRPVDEQEPRIDRGTLPVLLTSLSAALSRARRTGGTINPWTAAGLKRREVRNAAALASLWSVGRCGDVACAFLGEFLVRATRLDGQLPGHEDLLRGYVVRTEHSPDGNGRERVDLTIETDGHLVGIEVKIDAGEGPEQLARYLEAVTRSAEALRKKWAVILLAPFPPSHRDVLAADWSFIRAAAAAAVPARQTERTYADNLVLAFARHARSF